MAYNDKISFRCFSAKSHRLAFLFCSLVFLFVGSVGAETSTDLAITKTDSIDPVAAGANLTYTIMVTNNGPEDASTVSATDVLPEGVTLLTTSTSQGSWTEFGGLLAYDLGNLAAGADATITVLVNVDIATTETLTNTAVVSGSVMDTNFANNSASEETTIDSGLATATPTNTSEPPTETNTPTFTKTKTSTPTETPTPFDYTVFDLDGNNSIDAGDLLLWVVYNRDQDLKGDFDNNNSTESDDLFLFSRSWGVSISGPTNTPTPTSTYPPEVDTRMLVIMTDWAEQLGEFSEDKPTTELSQEAAAWILSATDVVATEISSSSDTIFVEMADGTYKTIYFPESETRFADEDDPFPPEGATAPSAVRSVALSSLDQIAIAGDPIMRIPQMPTVWHLPTNKKVLLMDSTTFRHSDHRATISQWFQARGYTVTSASANIEDYKHLSEYGTILLRAHGGFYKDEQTGDKKFALSTTDDSVTWTVAHVNSPLLEDTTNGRLVKIYSGFRSATSETGKIKLVFESVFWVSMKFLTDYNSTFPSKSIFYTDACDSAKTSELWDTLKAKGMGYFLGWTQPVSNGFASKVRRYIFDRSLAADSFSKGIPPYRTFNFPEVYAHLDNYTPNLLTDPIPPGPYPAAHLEIRFADESGFDQGPLFAPSVYQCISTDATTPETGQQFEVGIAGFFGNAQGSVKLNGNNMSILHWTGNQIITRISQGSSGVIKITTATGVESDPLQLIRYSGEATYDYNDGGAPDIRVQVNSAFHVMPFIWYRQSVDELLIPGQVRGGSNWIEGSSLCAWAVVGHESDGDGGTYTYSGSGSKRYDQSTSDAGFSKATGNSNYIDIDEYGEATLSFQINCPYMVHHVNVPKGIDDTWETSHGASFDIVKTLDYNDYSIPAGQFANQSSNEAVSWKKMSAQPAVQDNLRR